jgi:hypothetical protein
MRDGCRAVLLVAVVATMVLVGCGQSDEARFSDVGSAVSGGGESREITGEAGTEVDTGGSGEERADADEPGVSLAGATLVESGRKIVSTANTRVEVESVAAATTEAVTATEAAGGVLFGESSTYEDTAEAILTLKVPPEEFRPMLTRLSELGELRSQEVTTDDVTERAVDLGSRINTAEASVERLRGFLGEASAVDQVAQLENELLVRETDLETLRGQLRTLDEQVELATIVATFTEKGEEPREEKEEEEDEALPGFLDGLQGGWTAFVSTATVTLAGLGAVLPFAAFTLAVVGLIWLVRRRRPARAPAG